MTAGMGNNIETQLMGDIDGLEMVWVSGTDVTVNSGSAQIQSTGNLIRLTTPIAVTGISLGNNVWGHIYLYDSAGTPSVEVSTTAPDAPYFATARSKTGDATRRYIGSVRTDGSGNIRKFANEPLSCSIMYLLAGAGTDYRVLNSGTATTSTTVSMAAVVPLTSTLVLIKASNTDTTLVWTLAQGDDVANHGVTGYLATAGGVRSVFPAPLNADQEATYDWPSAPTGAAFIDVLGYWYKR